MNVNIIFTFEFWRRGSVGRGGGGAWSSNITPPGRLLVAVAVGGWTLDDEEDVDDLLVEGVCSSFRLYSLDTHLTASPVPATLK